MLDWLFGRQNHDISDLIRILSKGINVNINVRGEINVKEERGNIMAERESKTFVSDTTVTDGADHQSTAEREEPIPDLSKLQIPKVKFGNEQETD
jgi:hypothetical protein